LSDWAFLLEWLSAPSAERLFAALECAGTLGLFLVVLGELWPVIWAEPLSPPMV
jgi:hypothetical protein